MLWGGPMRKQMGCFLLCLLHVASSGVVFASTELTIAVTGTINTFPAMMLTSDSGAKLSSELNEKFRNYINAQTSVQIKNMKSYEIITITY